MWICSQLGFFSIVADRENPGNLLVRARDRGHLDALLANESNPRVGYTPANDYPYRTSLSKHQVARLLEEVTESIDYPNFKDRVDYNARWRGVGPWYAQALHRVWEVMYAAAKDKR
jgi:hypothetical protein